MVQKGTAVRGRPRKFDTDTVLDLVRDTFWRYGYAGTSMDQLAAATGLHKPSLYGAFGDKKQLFLAALDNYLAEVRVEFAEAFALPRLEDSLAAIRESAIDKFTHGDCGGMGCFMMNTAMPEAGHDPEISLLVRNTMEALEQALVERLEQAIEDGDLAETADPHELALILVANHYEMSARARAGYSREELRTFADRALVLVRKLGGVGSRQAQSQPSAA